jgi:hypothetical protein
MAGLIPYTAAQMTASLPEATQRRAVNTWPGLTNINLPWMSVNPFQLPLCLKLRF